MNTRKDYILEELFNTSIEKILHLAIQTLFPIKYSVSLCSTLTVSHLMIQISMTDPHDI